MISEWVELLSLGISILFSPLTPVEFQSLIKSKIISAQKVEFLGKDYFDQDGNFGGPIHTLIPLLAVQVKPPFIKNSSNYCLFYRSPQSQKTGSLLFLQTTLAKPCDEAWPTWPEIELTGITQLSLKQVSYNMYEINWTLQNGVHSEWKWEFFNIKGTTSIPQRYSSYQYNRGHKGRPLSWPISSFSEINLGIPSTKPPSPWRCRSFNDREELIQNDCERCPWSVLPVFNARRQSELAYECTPKKCGERGTPPCFLGAGHLDEWEEADICTNGEEIGTCRDGAKPTCAKNSDLLCP